MTIVSNQLNELFDDITAYLCTLPEYYTGELSNYEDVTNAIIELCGEILESDTDESTWYLGEGGPATLQDLIIGAYWHYTEYHQGQASSGYEALSALGDIYTPGMESGPSEGTAEIDIYDYLGELALP